MTPDQIKAKAEEKIKQIQVLLSALHINMRAVDKINDDGIIEKIVIFRDMEDYPKAQPIVSPFPDSSNETKDVS